MLGHNIQYEFEPCQGDKIDKITVHDDNSEEILNSESVKCVSRIQKETKTIRECMKKIQKIQQGHKVDDVSGDNESKVDELKLVIRRSETAKAKAEFKLEVLKEGGS